MAHNKFLDLVEQLRIIDEYFDSKAAENLEVCILETAPYIEESLGLSITDEEMLLEIL